MIHRIAYLATALVIIGRVLITLHIAFGWIIAVMSDIIFLHYYKKTGSIGSIPLMYFFIAHETYTFFAWL